MKLLSIFLTMLAFLSNLTPLHEAGYRGEGITIAVIDGGFYGVDEDTLIFPKEHIIGWKDFLGDEESFFRSADEQHGAMVLSTMLMEKDEEGQPFGTAPDANYYLIRTEDMAKEYAGEMDNLARGIRYADSIGADIITISLGYRLFDDSIENLTYTDLNGQSAVSRAATEAARHNRLVCVAAGNDGTIDWHYISVPSDADSILTVGAVGTDSLPGAFSSFGPTADGRNKPEVSEWGVRCPVYSPLMQAIGISNGTSFATPRIAGMAACLWQAFPQLSAMQLRQLIIESASNYPEWEAQAGYGIPNPGRIFSKLSALEEPEACDIPTDGPAVYYNLQGMRLGAAPEHGFFIEMRGNKARKILRP